MDTYQEAIRRIEENDLNNLEIFKLIEKNLHLSRLFWFKGDKVKYRKDEYEKLKQRLHNKI